MEIYKSIESLFERISNNIFRLLGNSLVFLLAVALTVFWFCVHDWSRMTITDTIRDLIVAITFLSFFIIQRTFIHFSQALHLKLNELIMAHENARNHIIKAEEKTGEEIAEMGKDHERLASEDESENL